MLASGTEAIGLGGYLDMCDTATVFHLWSLNI